MKQFLTDHFVELMCGVFIVVFAFATLHVLHTKGSTDPAFALFSGFTTTFVGGLIMRFTGKSSVSVPTAPTK